MNPSPFFLKIIFSGSPKTRVICQWCPLMLGLKSVWFICEKCPSWETMTTCTVAWRAPDHLVNGPLTNLPAQSVCLVPMHTQYFVCTTRQSAREGQHQLIWKNMGWPVWGKYPQNLFRALRHPCDNEQNHRHPHDRIDHHHHQHHHPDDKGEAGAPSSSSSHLVLAPHRVKPHDLCSGTA